MSSSFLSPVWLSDLLGNTILRLPESPRRTRTVPMQVICVGLPRSGTESLQAALQELGYDHTYHGWDVLLEDPTYVQEWYRLMQKKYAKPAHDGSPKVTTEDFDRIIGHCAAITDVVGSCFAAELIEAYPEAKVVLNVRRDTDAWIASLDKTFGKVERSLLVKAFSWFSPKMFWSYQVWFGGYGFLPTLLRSPSASTQEGLRSNARWVLKEHCAAIRGMVPQERLLEWKVEDGWEPLCKFLGKEIPKAEFPHANKTNNFGDKMDGRVKLRVKEACVNLALFVAVAVGLIAMLIVGFDRSSWQRYLDTAILTSSGNLKK